MTSNASVYAKHMSRNIAALPPAHQKQITELRRNWAITARVNRALSSEWSSDERAWATILGLMIFRGMTAHYFIDRDMTRLAGQTVISAYPATGNRPMPTHEQIVERVVWSYARR